MPVVSVLIPRFGLLVALEDGGADEGVMEERCRAMAKPVALAPEPGAAQLVGEVSERAEAMGVRAGMRVGEALSRCPELSLIPPDSERAERSWERVLRRLEGIGAEVESERPGEAFFEAASERRLEGVIAKRADRPYRSRRSQARAETGGEVVHGLHSRIHETLPSTQAAH